VIVTIGSVAGNVALPWAAAYSASKAALHSIHDALRAELRGTSIHLIKVCPGIVDTEFYNNVFDGERPDRVRNIRRIVSPDAVADAIFRALEKRRSTVYLPLLGWVFSALGRVAPTVIDGYLSRLLHTPESIGSVPNEESQETRARD